MKRANGTGSVYKLSGRRRNPWIARRAQSNGERSTVGTYPTKAAAEQALALDVVIPSSELKNLTVKEVFEGWKKTRDFTDLSRSAKDTYTAAFRYFSAYHSAKFADLRRVHFQKCIDSASNMSYWTQNRIKILAGILSRYAVTEDIVFKSYAAGLKTKKREKKNIKIFTDFEIKKLFENDNIPYVDAVLILIYTGLRINELLNIYKVNTNIDEMYIKGGSKTDAGRNRIVPIHPRIQSCIKNRYDNCENFLIEENGKPLTAKKFRKIFYDVLEKLSIEKRTPHTTRHTFFSMLDAACTDKKAMADVGGHTDPRFSEKQYSHPDIDRLRRAVESIK